MVYLIQTPQDFILQELHFKPKTSLGAIGQHKTARRLSILGCAKDPSETWSLPLATNKGLFGPNRIAVGGRPEVEPSGTSALSETNNISLDFIWYWNLRLSGFLIEIK